MSYNFSILLLLLCFFTLLFAFSFFFYKNIFFQNKIFLSFFFLYFLISPCQIFKWKKKVHLNSNQIDCFYHLLCILQPYVPIITFQPQNCLLSSFILLLKSAHFTFWAFLAKSHWCVCTFSNNNLDSERWLKQTQ